MKLHRRLYIKFTFAYVVFAVISFISVAAFTSSLIGRHLIKQRADALYREAVLVANSYASRIYSGSISVEDAGKELSAVDTYISCPIWVLDSSGRIVIDTRDIVKKTEESGKRAVRDKKLQELPERRIEAFDPTLLDGYYQTGSFYGCFEEDTLSVFAPITTGFSVRGYVVMHTSLSSIFASRDEILNYIYIALGIIVLLSLLILLVFSVVVYAPLNKITKGTEAYVRGEYDHKINIHTNDEMGYLASTLTYMASEIARTEENQKKFIANVSHDFRSPLTSIRGYLEAMLDGTIPVELYEKYLKIVLNETDRLKKLTDSLLTLNNLNVKGILLDIKVFDINQVIKQTAELFEGSCRKKRLGIQLVLSGETMRVKADEERIKQVLYNLLDNALKFSNYDSEIKIETTLKNEKLFVSVRDYGIGIPKESVGFVFDRFYKTDLSRGKDKKGTGLGLSIVKEIINAHKENINVISTEGAGTEFIFTLTSAETD